MAGEMLSTIGINLIGLSCAIIGFFVVRKKAFIETEKFTAFKNMLFLPLIVNYWIVKIILIVGGLFLVFFMIYLMIQET